MTQTVTQGKVLTVAVELPAARHELAADVLFRNSVADYCKALPVSLELPTQVELAVSASRPDRRVRVAIGEDEITLSLHESEAADPSQLINQTLYRCRDSLVTESTARQVWSEWFPNCSSAEASLEGVVWLLKAAARHGLRTGRFQAAVTARGPATISRTVAEEIFEEVAGPPDAASVKIFVSRAQYARCFEGDKDKPLPLAGESVDFPSLLEAMAEGLFYEIGILYHLAPVEVDDRLQAPWFRIQLNDVLAPLVKGLAPNEFLANETVSRLALLNLKAVSAINPANGMECAIVSGEEETRQIATLAGLTTWGPESYVVLCAAAEIRANAGALVNLALVDLFACQLGESFPDLMQAALGRFGQRRLTRILRLLAIEQTSLRDLRGVLDSLLAVDGTTWADLAKFIVFTPSVYSPCPAETGRGLDDLRDEDYADCVRMALRRYLSRKYVRGGNTLVVYLIDPEIERRMTAPTPFSPSERSALLDAITNEIGSLPSIATLPVFLTTFEVRRRLRRLIKRQFPRVAVLSYQELSPDLNIQPLARISLG